MKQTDIDSISDQLKYHFHANKVIGLNRNKGVWWEVTWNNKKRSKWYPDSFVNFNNNREIADTIIKEL